MSAPQPEHDLHQWYLVQVGTASALAALTALVTATASGTLAAALNTLTATTVAAAVATAAGSSESAARSARYALLGSAGRQRTWVHCRHVPPHLQLWG